MVNELIKLSGQQVTIKEIIEDNTVIHGDSIRGLLLETEYGKLEGQYYKNDSKDKLDRAIEQALFHLRKKNVIRREGRGIWGLR